MTIISWKESRCLKVYMVWARPTLCLLQLYCKMIERNISKHWENSWAPQEAPRRQEIRLQDRAKARPKEREVTTQILVKISMQKRLKQHMMRRKRRFRRSWRFLRTMIAIMTRAVMMMMTMTIQVTMMKNTKMRWTMIVIRMMSSCRRVTTTIQVARRLRSQSKIRQLLMALRKHLFRRPLRVRTRMSKSWSPATPLLWNLSKLYQFLIRASRRQAMTIPRMHEMRKGFKVKIS